MHRLRHIVGDGALWIALVLLFGLVATIKILAQTSPTCSYSYSSWGECSSSGTQTRTVESRTPDECSGDPELSRSCSYTPPTCSFTYSSWNACQPNGTQTRSVQSASPSGCTGTPTTSQSCTYSGGGTTCAFTYNSWGACQSNGTQTRSVQSATPSGCTGTPVVSQSCTYSGGGGTTCAFTYNSWGECLSSGIRNRTVASATPTGCTGGTPVLSETCTYSGGSGGSNICSFTYSSWSACQSNGTQTRTVLSAYPTGCLGGTPTTSQSCTYSGGGGTTCAFTYNSWSDCSSSGMQTRTVQSATPTGCTGTPELSRSCTYSGSTTSSTTSTAQTTSTTASSCAFTYSSWSNCLSSGKRTRSVQSATPTGCVGTPNTSESCTYVGSDGTTTSASACSFTYSSWGTCSPNGIQSRAVLSSGPSNCVGNPVVTQTCVPTVSSLPVCAYTYSSWGMCQSNGLQTRGVLSQAPASCSGSPEVTRSCVATTTTTTATSGSTTASTSSSSTLSACAYTYSPWGLCQPGNFQTRSALSRTPASCSGDPFVSQYCPYSSATSSNTTVAPLCVFSYTPWSACQSTGMETRSVFSKTPTSCVGTPEIARACTYAGSDGSTVSATACAFSYSPWIGCQSTGVDTRSVLSKTPSVCVGTPDISHSCSYSPLTASTSSALSNFTFSDLPAEANFSGKARVAGVVSGADRVEYMLVNPLTNAASSLGNAEKTRENFWEASFDSTVFANGPYFLFAKIQISGEAKESSRMKVVIGNSVAEIARSESVSSGSSSSGETPSGSGSTPDLKTAEQLPVLAFRDFRGATTGKWQKLYFGDETCREEGVCGSEADPDGDDLSNKDEFRLNTNPLASDTDDDGFSDGKEVRDGFNPLIASRGDKNDQVTYENPKETGSIEKDLFAVGNVEVVPAIGESDTKGLKLSGRGPANTLLTIFVYSELPTVLSVKTDADGNWSYTLDRNLEDGDHQAYVAVTDHAGKIAAKSEPLAFVKTAEAATIVPTAAAENVESSVAPTERRKISDWMFVAIFSVMGLVGALLLIGFFLRRQKNREASSEKSGHGDASVDGGNEDTNNAV